MNHLMNPTVCILTVGVGSSIHSYAPYINKALLPINQKTVISDIINKFPENTEFVVTIGYLGNQIKDLLAMTHPYTNISFIEIDKEIDNYNEFGNIPGYSLLCCQHLLHKPFYIVSCDILLEDKINIDSEHNWVGISKANDVDITNYCNFEGFTGLCYIKDYNIFWDCLNSSKFGKYQISDSIHTLADEKMVKQYDIEWINIGTLENYKKAISRYEKYDFGKTNEFIYIDNGRVIKFFADQTIVEKRVAKAALNPGVFPNIIDRRGQFYCYPFIPGKTFYEISDIDIFKKLLKWLDQNLWIETNTNVGDMRQICKTFYYEKTLDRLSMYYRKYNDTDVENIINGIKVPTTSDLIKQIPWERLYSGKPSFFHGDLQFDNIICTNQKNFILLDWRQDFGGHVEFGDLYYDLAKLYCGIILNYDYVKKKLISYKEEGSTIYFDFAQRYSTKAYLSILMHFIKENGWDDQKICVLAPLIFLNMSPLHNYPFDKILYALGRLILAEELKNNNKEKYQIYSH